MTTADERGDHGAAPSAPPLAEDEPSRQILERRRLRHDARSALNQILGYAELVEERAAEDGHGGYGDDLSRIRAAARRLLGLVEQLGADSPVATGLASSTERASIAPACARSTESLLPASPQASASLLVVDDNEANRDLLTRRLGRAGYDVVAASGGAEALALVGERPFHLVLLDVMMPGISGLEVLERIRESHSAAALPVVMATARDGSEDVVAALRLGANDYVTKPLDMPVVLARVDTQLSLKRARDEVQRLNLSLAEAQERIAKLGESAAFALEDIDAWSAAAAREIADALGLPEVSVFLGDDDRVKEHARSSAAAPTVADLACVARSGRHIDREADTVVPVQGLSGELFGVLVVPSVGLALSDMGKRLLGGFARQLGGALELRRTRTELAASAARRQERRAEMVARGVDLLQLCPACGRCYDQRAERCESDGSALESPAAFPVRIAGRYRLRRRLGEGGMGTVFEADDDRLGRRVAVKVLKSEHFGDEKQLTRFEREARTVARIDHPGVVEVHDCGAVEDGSLFIVMELLRGWSLRQVLRACGPGAPAQVAKLLRLGGPALTAAHRAGILHRDIKPDNVFLTGDLSDFDVKLVDFGIAKEIGGDTLLTQTGTLVGTPLYMSPEQILCQALDARSDLYSFAAVAYRALSGRRVTPHEVFVDVLVDIVHNEPPAISTLVSGVPAELDAAFRHALAKDPSERPASVEEWAGQTASLLDGVVPSVDGWTEERCAEVQSGTQPWAPPPSPTAATRAAN